MSDKNVIERAFELAKSGSTPSIALLKARLRSEGFNSDHIYGKLLSTQLRKIMLDAGAVNGPSQIAWKPMFARSWKRNPGGYPKRFHY